MKVSSVIILDFALVLGGKLLNLGVVFLGGVLLVRTAGPVEYGVFAVAMTWVLLGDGFVGGPFDLATVRFAAMHPGEDGKVRRFEAFALQTKLAVATLAALGIWVIRPALAERWPEAAITTFPMIPSLLALLGLLLARSTATGLQNRRRFRVYAALDFAQGIVRVSAFGIFAWKGEATGTAFLYAYGLAALGAGLFGCLVLGQSYLFGRWPAARDSAGLLRYSGFAAGIVVLATLTGRGDVALLSAMTGVAGAATYALASQITQLVGQMAMYASILTQPRVMAFRRDGRLRRIAGWNVLAVMVVLVPLLAAWDLGRVDRLVPMVFGPGFEPSGGLIRILGLGVMVDWMIVPIVVMFCVQDSPGRSFMGEAAVAILFLAAAGLVLSGSLPWAPQVCVAWLSVGCRLAKAAFYGGIFLRRSAD